MKKDGMSRRPIEVEFYQAEKSKSKRDGNVVEEMLALDSVRRSKLIK